MFILNEFFLNGDINDKGSVIRRILKLREDIIVV